MKANTPKTCATCHWRDEATNKVNDKTVVENFCMFDPPRVFLLPSGQTTSVIPFIKTIWRCHNWAARK